MQEPQRVSAAEFIRGFANWRLQSTRKPVFVTHHGKDAHVLISLDDYHRLGNDRSSGEGVTLARLRDSLADLVESIRDMVILIDRFSRIVAVNPAASDMLEIPAAQLIGQDIATVLPGIKGSLLFNHLGRLIDHRARFSGDVPGLLKPAQWLHVDLIPVPVGGAIIVRDVSPSMEAMADTDARQALHAAMTAHGDLGHARLSVREAIEDANEALTRLVGVDRAALRRVRFSALLPIGRRQAFVEALENVFRTGDPARLASEIVTREGNAVSVTLAIAELRGAYASDGAIILMSPRPDE